MFIRFRSDVSISGRGFSTNYRSVEGGNYIFKTFHPYRPVWYVPDQGMEYTIQDNWG